MFEQPTIRRTLRIASASARAIAACSVLAAYVAAGDRLARYSGKANRRLDRLVEARAGTDGALESSRAWRYALFFRGTGKVRGAFVLRSAAEPSGEEMFLLRALAEPTGAALAAAELIGREHRETAELRQRGEAQVGSNRTMAATIVRLNMHQQIRDSIVAAAGSADGEARIVEALSALTHRSVVLQDSFGNERAFIGVGYSGAPDDVHGPVATLVAGAAPTAGWRSAPIRAGGETLGVIGIYDPDDDQSTDDRFAVDFAGAMIAVELANHRRVAEVEVRLGRDLADELVTGGDVVDAFARAESLHFDLSGFHRVALVSWERPTPNGVEIGDAVRHALEAMRIPALISRRGDGVLVVVADRDDLSGLYARLSASVFSVRGTIGVGGRCIAGDLPRSFAEATRAKRLRVESRRPYGLSNHDDLGLLRILDLSDGGAEVDRYVDEWLGALIAHDRSHHSELVHTLTVYLDAGGNYDRTADALTIGRSTLRYRLGRIREMSGRDLTDPDSRLNLHLAVRVRAARLR
ncbi:PucR family transcriptional regulator [Leifsonia naganoensis]|uniref:Sugar diacid utilization regulator n=1 Tax=Leifsonia naganoensis TaxID=150025 RepID=A0A853DPF4_9MICO|nr:helix-turn-helix domain-containing protein [Leifsonia naganoensis]NYK09503.1 sugar diacid utilization regulator [Leifsonia naganoensis]